MEKTPLPVAALLEKTKDKQPVVLLDVRDEEKFRAGSLHLDDTQLLHCPYVTMVEHEARLSELIASLPADTQLVTVCTSGNKAEKAAELLRSKGVAARSLQGGLTAWHQRENDN